MTRVPLDERRRLFVARQQAGQAVRDQLRQPLPATSPVSAEPWRSPMRLVFKAIMVAMLLGAGLLALHTITFHPPESLVEALLPRY